MSVKEISEFEMDGLCSGSLEGAVEHGSVLSWRAWNHGEDGRSGLGGKR